MNVSDIRLHRQKLFLFILIEYQLCRIMSRNNSVIDSNSHSNVYSPKISYNSLGFGIVVPVFGFNDNVIHMFEISIYIISPICH